MSIIKFSNFHFRYKGNEEYALNNINLEINKNQFILLAGETGSGKTTLIRCINGLIPQFYSGFYKGSVEIDGVKTTDTTISELSRKVGIVFQNPENQLISMNVLHELVFGPENLGFSKEEIQKRLGEVITLTGIENILDKPPFELSGIQKKEEITVIISEHRMDLILSLIDDIILMNEGKVILFNSKENVVNSPEFKQINVNKPTIYSIFSELKKKGLFHQNIPVSISSAIKSLQELQR
jgi:energy-coupling factor transporter ATP-binding protein EcfA2